MKIKVVRRFAKGQYQEGTVTCTQRDICQYYDTNRTICVPVKVSDYG